MRDARGRHSATAWARGGFGAASLGRRRERVGSRSFRAGPGEGGRGRGRGRARHGSRLGQGLRARRAHGAGVEPLHASARGCGHGGARRCGCASRERAAYHPARVEARHRPRRARGAAGHVAGTGVGGHLSRLLVRRPERRRRAGRRRELRLAVERPVGHDVAVAHERVRRKPGPRRCPAGRPALRCGRAVDLPAAPEHVDRGLRSHVERHRGRRRRVDDQPLRPARSDLRASLRPGLRHRSRGRGQPQPVLPDGARRVLVRPADVLEPERPDRLIPDRRVDDDARRRQRARRGRPGR